MTKCIYCGFCQGLLLRESIISLYGITDMMQNRVLSTPLSSPPMLSMPLRPGRSCCTTRRSCWRTAISGSPSSQQLSEPMLPIDETLRSGTAKMLLLLFFFLFSFFFFSSLACVGIDLYVALELTPEGWGWYMVGKSVVGTA